MSKTSHSMQGQTVFMTGFTAGLGRAGAADLVSRGAHVVGLCRNGEKGEAVAREIRTLASEGVIDVMIPRLLSSVDRSIWLHLRGFAAFEMSPGHHELVEMVGEALQAIDALIAAVDELRQGDSSND